MVQAANVEIESIWCNLLAKALEGKNIKELLSNVGSGGAPAAGSAAVPTSGTAAPEPPKEEEKKEEEKEESDDDMVRALFDLQLFLIIVNGYFTTLYRALDFSIDLPRYIHNNILGDFLVRCGILSLAPCQFLLQTIQNKIDILNEIM